MTAATGRAYQRGNDGESILNALQSREQGLQLNSITAFTFRNNGEFRERIEAKSAELKPGAWQLKGAHVYAPNMLPQDFETYSLPTKLTREQVAES
jgi:lipopolysaccharide export system permease protein